MRPELKTEGAEAPPPLCLDLLTRSKIFEWDWQPTCSFFPDVIAHSILARTKSLNDSTPLTSARCSTSVTRLGNDVGTRDNNTQ